MSTVGLIVAGGTSTRFGGDIPKQFLQVAGRPLLSWTIDRFEQAAQIDSIVVVVAEEYLLHTSEKIVDPFGFSKVTKIVIGGDSRQESVRRGLEALPLSTGFVAIHDGARPIVAPSDIDAVVLEGKSSTAAILAVPVTDATKRARDGYVMATIDRSNLYRAQTPQVFQYDLIREVHRKAVEQSVRLASDDSDLVIAAGFKVRLVETRKLNIKVTTRNDLALVRPILEAETRG